MGGTISVVITCYELGRTLEAALESVTRQTQPAADVVVVDDGSTDLYTREVLARLERRGVRVVRAEHRGVSAARNRGVRRTAGEYVVHLDADDAFDPTYFEKAGALLDADPTLDFVSCALRGFGEAAYVWRPAPLDFVDAVASGGVVHVGTMLRRRLWEAIGGYDEAFQGHEDLDFWASVLERGFRGVVLEEPLLHYRVRAGSTYRRAIQPENHRALLARFYDKHRAAVAAHGPELIVGKERFILEQREHLARLRGRRSDLERELADLREEIAGLVRTLAARGASRVDWGELRRLAPLSPEWGGDRGKPVNRHYIEAFLAAHRADVTGRVLEVKDAGYTEAFGTGVDRRDVLDVNPANPQATLVADLTHGAGIPSETFDCFILTQVLNVNYDIRAALAHAHRSLKPGGVLLCTVAALDRVSYEDRGLDGDYWRFTEASMRELAAERFPLGAFEVRTYGNVLACAAFLFGLSAEELTADELNASDPWFPLIVAVRAVKPTVVSRIVAAPGVQPSARDGDPGGAILLYHRIGALTPDTHGLCVSPADFRAQMDHLRRHRRPIALDALVEATRAGRIPAGAVAVTVDDGYLDALSTASEILLEASVPATFFVNPAELDAPREACWDTLERIFLDGAPIPDLLELELGDRRFRLATATAAERRAAHDRLTELCYPAGAEARGVLLGRLAAWSGLPLPPRESHRLMTGAELRRLAERPGHTIGAHTTHHLLLPAQAPEVQRHEVRDSRERLEQLLGQPVRAFAYPYGEHAPETVEVVRAAGFTSAVTCERAPVRPGGDLFRLPRVEVSAGMGEGLGRCLDELLGSARAPSTACRPPAASHGGAAGW